MLAESITFHERPVRKLLLLVLGAAAGAGASHVFSNTSVIRTFVGPKRRSAISVRRSDPKSGLQPRPSKAVIQENVAHERELRTLIDALPALVWRATPDGQQDYANRRFLEYLGQTIDLSIGDGWLHFLHPDDVDSTLQSWVEAVASGTSYRHTYRFRRADGVYRWFESVAQPLRDETGRIVRWYGVLFEFDERRQAEDALRSMQISLQRATQVATVAELSASIAHEINQPLAAILANSEACRSWLLKSPPNIERASLTAERLVRDGKAAAEVVLRIRRLFQQGKPNKEPLDANEVLREVISLMGDEITKRKVLVRDELDKTIPAILADRTQLQQVLTNLIANAVDAMSDDPIQPKVLAIRSRCTQEIVRVDIRDSGRGFDALATMFEPFFTTKRKGMGMGLAISKAIVDSHGGDLWASRNPDKGLTVSLSLPLDVEVSR